jgi:hypothetical protein
MIVKHSDSGIYEKNMVIEIYDTYDISSGGGVENGDMKITTELINIIERLNDYLGTEITIGFYLVDGYDQDYDEVSFNNLIGYSKKFGDQEELWRCNITQLDINTKTLNI